MSQVWLPGLTGALYVELGFYEDISYSRNNMRQKCGGYCGLWILNEIIKKTYAESLKKIVGAVWELPAK